MYNAINTSLMHLYIMAAPDSDKFAEIISNLERNKNGKIITRFQRTPQSNPGDLWNQWVLISKLWPQAPPQLTQRSAHKPPHGHKQKGRSILCPQHFAQVLLQNLLLLEHKEEQRGQ